MSFADSCSSGRKFCSAQLLFKRTGPCQFRWQWWRNITFLWWLLAKNWFVSGGQFLLTDHTGTGSCAFAHVVLLNSVVYTKTKGPSRPFGLFLLRGISYPRQCLGCQCELWVVCVYFFAWFTVIAYRVAVSIISPCRNHGRPIMKNTVCGISAHINSILFMVDLAGVEPASRMPSLWRDYNNSLHENMYQNKCNQ